MKTLGIILKVELRYRGLKVDSVCSRVVVTRVARFAFQGQKTFFKLVGLDIFKNLLGSWPFFKSIEAIIVKY